MRCVERVPEYMDGLLLVALLRAREIDAQLFDENFVRQDWFKILAYGGFRVMVPARDWQDAQRTLVEFRSGALHYAEDEMDRPICPACHAYSGEFDHRQRRWVFLAYFINALVLSLCVIFLAEPLIVFFALTCVFWLAMMMPGLLRFIVNNRLRCSFCSHAWREPPLMPFSRQQQAAENALNPQAT